MIEKITHKAQRRRPAEASLVNEVIDAVNELIDLANKEDSLVKWVNEEDGGVNLSVNGDARNLLLTETFRKYFTLKNKGTDEDPNWVIVPKLAMELTMTDDSTMPKMYWANIPISKTSSEETSPTVKSLTIGKVKLSCSDGKLQLDGVEFINGHNIEITGKGDYLSALSKSDDGKTLIFHTADYCQSWKDHGAFVTDWSQYDEAKCQRWAVAAPLINKLREGQGTVASYKYWANQELTKEPSSETQPTFGKVTIGNVTLEYDVEHNALKIIKSDGTAANFWTTGGVSAYGYQDSQTPTGAEYFGDLLDKLIQNPEGYSGKAWGYDGKDWGFVEAGKTYQGDNTYIKVDNTTGIISFMKVLGDLAYKNLANLYWANLNIKESEDAATEPTFGKVTIGNVTLEYDAEHNALKIIKSDGTAANFWTTGGVSAYGYQDSSLPSVSWTQEQTDGKEIAVITINGKETKVYAPDGSEDVSSYNDLTNKPRINGYELIGNKTSADLGFPESLPASGGNADTVDNLHIKTVSSAAECTDANTIYIVV